ncbi:hypothetical protein BJQ94_13180 [Cryobacterium sp. SO2]|uniref:hypothetical protein n=1 Tax=Cryobacterium sp. SO2 TaxID=1897060 RepID=UPI00223D4A9C|nr:hypothetical protein [Cryobacterium sp. SO2]WEO76311.1 hypothetical protein BJQ94_13180 [Cryobacterium sp. SO2]
MSVDEATAHAFAHTAMAGRRYTPVGERVDGVVLYQYGTLLTEFLSEIAGLPLILRLAGRPYGYAKIAVWTEPAAGGTRVSVSLLTGLFHAEALRLTVDELIRAFDTAGTLLRAGEPFSGIDLPPASPGRPLAHRRWRSSRA